MSTENPKLFISYSWSSQEHEKWVIDLATELVESGVDVTLDKWDLKEGHDSYAFMEQMVTDPEIKKVIIISDKVYADKADGRSGGVGTETQIITPELYQKKEQNKFVVVVKEKDEDGKPYVPTYYKSRIHIDLSDDDLYATNFEQLLRWIYDQPLHEKPKLGQKPAFLDETNPIKLGTTAKYKRALDAIKHDKSYTKGAIDEYFETLSQNLEEFRISKNEFDASNPEGEFDDEIIENIEKFIPYKSEAVELFLAIAQYRNEPETWQQIHSFFESLIPYMSVPEGVTYCSSWDFDNFKFIIEELFLCAISSLLKYECFDAIKHLTTNYYYVEKNAAYGKDTMRSYCVFNNQIKSLVGRNQRLNKIKHSLKANIMKQRSEISSIKFKQIMQADFILFINQSFNALNYHEYQEWWPETLFYSESHSAAFEVFARAQSTDYFNKVKRIFNIAGKDELGALIEAFKENKLHVPSWGINTINPESLLGYEKLATRP